jgi:hypothetical protein
MHEEMQSFLDGWERWHELPSYPRNGLRIPPEEQFFKDIYYGVNSWSNSDIKQLIEDMDYEPSDSPTVNYEFIKNKITEIFTVIEASAGCWLINKDTVEEIFAE